MHYSYAEYLALEEDSQVRHQYLDGEIYAMPGGTPDHAALAARVLCEKLHSIGATPDIDELSRDGLEDASRTTR